MVEERVITVEYLDPPTSKELLFKFPDESAFGFDYEQSAIWSPLVPRGHGANTSTSCPLTGIQGGKAHGHRKRILQGKLGNVKGKITKKRTNALKNSVGMKMKNRNLETPNQEQGWGGKLFKAATKHFKKQKRSPTHRILRSNNI